MTLLDGPPQVITAGASLLAESLREQAADVTAVAWRPPLAGTAGALARILADPRRHAADELAVRRLTTARPYLVGVRRASEVLRLPAGMFLHAGPPIDLAAGLGPDAGRADRRDAAGGVRPRRARGRAAALSAGQVRLEPCHQHATVGPMAGVVSPSMWMFEVRDAEHGGTAYCSLNEGLGKVLRYGAYGPEVLDRLRWMDDVLGPVLSAAVELAGPIDLRSLIAQALQMGDELHNRNRAATSLLLRELAPAVADAAPATASEVLRFINGNDHFFLNAGMAAAKVSTDAASDVPGSSLVVAMARNGTDFGVQVSGLGDRGGSPARRACRTGSISARTARRTPIPTSATPPSPRRRGWAGSRWRRPRPSCGSSAARWRTRWRRPGRCTRSRWPSTPPTRFPGWASVARRWGST